MTFIYELLNNLQELKTIQSFRKANAVELLDHLVETLVLYTTCTLYTMMSVTCSFVCTVMCGMLVFTVLWEDRCVSEIFDFLNS